jgi:hypothetical protein
MERDYAARSGACQENPEIDSEVVRERAAHSSLFALNAAMSNSDQIV